MRKLSFFLVLISLWLFASCEDNKNRIWDIYPVVITVGVVDVDGNNLLDQEKPNCIDLTKVKAIYKEKEYPCNLDYFGDATKAYMPHFYGLIFNEKGYKENNLLKFGEFDGAKDYNNESVTIVWPDGTSDIISFNRDFKMKKKGPKVNQKWFLNGNMIEADGIIRIVK